MKRVRNYFIGVVGGKNIPMRFTNMQIVALLYKPCNVSGGYHCENLQFERTPRTIKVRAIYSK